MPHWSDLADVSKCVLLRSYGCKVACKGNCSCSRKSIICTVPSNVLVKECVITMKSLTKYCVFDVARLA